LLACPPKPPAEKVLFNVGCAEAVVAGLPNEPKKPVPVWEVPAAGCCAVD
jgi:hypothetical protein